MNQTPKRLKKEPLIEAIWQAQFEPKEGLPVGDLLPGILYSALKADYPNLQLHRLPTADIPAPVAQLDPNLRFSAKYRMEEPGSPFLFQVGDRVVTMNCRKPYAGWSVFKERILKFLEVIEGSGLVPTPMRHSLRYIDLLVLDPAPDLKALQIQFQIGQWNLANLPIQMRVEISDGDCNHVIQIATPAEANLPGGKLQGSVIDLETFSSAQPGSWQDVRNQIDQIHDRSKAVFYQQLLTADAIALMERSTEMLAITIDAPNIPQPWYPVVQQIQLAAEPPTPTYLEMLGKGFQYVLGNSSTVIMETAELPNIVRDVVAEAFKPKTEFGKRLLALRRAYVANGGPLLDAEAFDRELQRRRGGVSDE